MAITNLAPDAAERDVPEDDGAEESDEYEVGDEGEEVDDDEEDEEEEADEGGGLTALLLGGAIGNEEEDDEVWVPDGGKEPADYSGDEDDDVDEKPHPEEKTSQTSNKLSHANAAAVEEKPGISENTDGEGKRRREESSGNHVNKKARKV